MAGTPYSQEIFNTREELVSSDLMQAQNLLSRDVQDMVAAGVRSIDSANTVPGNGSNFDLLRAIGTPISALDIVPTFTPSAGLTATLGAGSGYSLYATGVASNQSTFQVLRWGPQTLTFDTGGGSPRIDTVYAAPAQQVTVTASRNVLVDPVARTVTAQSVNKQGDPVSTVGVIAGTPAASPVANASALAAIAGAVPLFYVYVPAGISATSGFGVCRGIWRRAPYPFAGMSGVINGVNLRWDLTAALGSNAAINCNGVCRIVIDGEVLEWDGVLSSAGTGFVQDTAANPFGSSAPAHWHRPYYIYAVGGRHNPTTSFDSGSGTLSPVIFVESTIVPDLASGKPTNTLALPAPYSANVQAGAAYVGLGFVFAGSTARLACLMDAQFTSVPGANLITPINFLQHAAGSTSYEAFDVNAPAVVPAISTEAQVVVQPGSTVASSVTVAPDRGDGGGVSASFGANGTFQPLNALTIAGPIQIPDFGVVTFNPNVPKFWGATNAGSGTISLAITGFNHRARLFAVAGLG